VFLRVVCQVCGKTEIIDVDMHILSFPRWDYYKLKDIVSDRTLIEGFENYYVWICPECHRNAIKYYEDRGWEVNWEKLSETVENSLRRKGGDVI